MKLVFRPELRGTQQAQEALVSALIESETAALLFGGQPLVEDSHDTITFKGESCTITLTHRYDSGAETLTFDDESFEEEGDDTETIGIDVHLDCPQPAQRALKVNHLLHILMKAGIEVICPPTESDH